MPYQNQYVSAVILCAGRSERMGTNINKQFLTVDGLPVAYRSIKIFEENENINEIIVVVSEDRLKKMRNLVQMGRFQKVRKIVVGGDSRTASSRIGVSQTSPMTEIVLIHDGARPLVDDLTIERVIDGVLESRAAAPGLPIKETVKKIDDQDYVVDTPDRDALVTVQTPQGFEKALYLEATLGLDDSTSLFDDCQLVEQLGCRVKIVKGNELNLKITTPEDVLLAEAICHMKKEMKYSCGLDTDMTSIHSKKAEN